MSNKDKMHTGELYLPGDVEIMKEQQICLDKLYDYNMTRPTESEKRQELLKEMFAEIGEDCYIEPPFHANFGGKHVHFGKCVYANFNFMFVSLEHAAYDGFDRIVADVRIFHEPVDIVLESHLLKRQLLDLVAVFRTFHFVFEAHLRISRLYLDGFCRIDGKIDGLVGDA